MTPSCEIHCRRSPLTMTKGRGARNCYSCGIQRNKLTNLKLFTFPKEVIRCTAWIQNGHFKELLDVDPLVLNKKRCLCSKHFLPEMFTNSKMERLNWNAVPSIFEHNEMLSTSFGNQLEFDAHVQENNKRPTVPITNSSVKKRTAASSEILPQKKKKSVIEILEESNNTNHDVFKTRSNDAVVRKMSTVSTQQSSTNEGNNMVLKYKILDKIIKSIPVEEISNSAVNKKTSALYEQSSKLSPCNGIHKEVGFDLGRPLLNHYNNCFVNSSLQALMHIGQFKKLCTELMDTHNEQTSSHQVASCFPCKLIKFFVHYTSPEVTAFLPTSILNHLTDIHSTLKLGEQEDSIVFLREFLAKLNEDTTNKFDSIFSGLMYTSVMCCNCNHLSITNAMSDQFSLNVINDHNLESVFNAFFEPSNIEPKLCKVCGTVSLHNVTFLMEKVPDTLCLELLRNDYNKPKGHQNIQVPVHLEMASNKLVDGCRFVKISTSTYCLSSAIHHFGQTKNCGHYTCAVRSHTTGDWYTFNDSQIHPSMGVKPKEVYIVFYTKVSEKVEQSICSNTQPIAFEPCQKSNISLCDDVNASHSVVKNDSIQFLTESSESEKSSIDMLKYASPDVLSVIDENNYDEPEFDNLSINSCISGIDYFSLSPTSDTNIDCDINLDDEIDSTTNNNNCKLNHDYDCQIKLHPLTDNNLMLLKESSAANIENSDLNLSIISGLSDVECYDLKSPNVETIKPPKNNIVNSVNFSGLNFNSVSDQCNNINKSTDNNSLLNKDINMNRQKASKKKLFSSKFNETRTILRTIGAKQKSQLTPRKGHVYKKYMEMRQLTVKYKNLAEKYRCQVQDLKKTFNERMYNEIENSIPDPTMGKIMINNLKIHQKSTPRQGHRWSINEKLGMVRIYKRSPCTYKLFESMLKLPSKSTLIRVLNKADFKPGINEPIFINLKDMGESMTEKERIAVLLFDETMMKEQLLLNIKKGRIDGFVNFGTFGHTHQTCKNALIFMLCGIFKPWKIALEYTYCKASTPGEILQLLIPEIIRRIRICNFEVVSTTCDQGPNNRKALRMLGASKKFPYFYVDNIRVYSMFDVPHLMKTNRNGLKKNKIIINGKNIEWKYIKGVYLFEKILGFKITNLKPVHFQAVWREVQKVVYAVQIFSHKVAVCIEVLVYLNIFPKEAEHTAKFCERLNKLFDSMNSKEDTINESSSKYKKPVTPNSDHFNLWKRLLKWIPKWDFRDARGQTVPTKDGWIWSINAMLLVCEDLFDRGYQEIFTYYFNQDSLEIFNGDVRKHCGTNDTPNYQQFGSAFKATLIEKYLPDKSSEKYSCSENNVALLSSLSNLLCSADKNQRDNSSCDTAHENSDHSDDHEEFIDEDNFTFEELDKFAETANLNCYKECNELLENVSSKDKKEIAAMQMEFASISAKTIYDKIVKQLSCQVCIDSISANKEELTHAQKLLHSDRNKEGTSNYPSDNFVVIFFRLNAILMKDIKYSYSKLDLFQHLSKKCIKNYNCDNLGCNSPDHKENLKKIFIKNLVILVSCIFVKEMNLKIDSKEEKKKKKRRSSKAKSSKY